MLKPPAPERIYEPVTMWYALVNYGGEAKKPDKFELPFYFSNIGLKSVMFTPEWHKMIKEHYLEFITDSHSPEQMEKLPATYRYLYAIPFGEDMDAQTEFEDALAGLNVVRKDERFTMSIPTLEMLIEAFNKMTPILVMTQDEMLEMGAHK